MIIGFFLLYSITSLSRSYSLFTENPSDAVTTQGVVQNVLDMYLPIYYKYDGGTHIAKYIVIDDVKYYCMDGNDFTIGSKVKITYLPKSKYILEMNHIIDD
ncbi:MAG: hypothetical protein J6Z36_00185 [Clostridia bacterium]|nr:hypothetical protein [Clostridia bacterium]